MKILENKTKYELEDIIGICEREKNAKRNYLLVNKFQGKHVPVIPSEAIGLFTQLGRELAEKYQNDQVTFIGFAETATAIGATVANVFGERGFYIQTTREEIDRKYAVVEFQEEHSHATEQLVFCKYPEEYLKNAKQIVFVEDEITTGKTILNFIREFEDNKYFDENTKIAVASIVNSMVDDNVNKFKEKNIDINYLIKIDNDFDNVEFSKENCLNEEQSKKADLSKCNVKIVEYDGRLEPRTGVSIFEYTKHCQELANNINEEIINFSTELANKFSKEIFDLKKETCNIKILGTEECMYPALICGQTLEKKYSSGNVRVHATTRSPIVPRNENGYFLKSRNTLDSIYEAGRKTFIYNLEKNDLTIIITDALKVNENGLTSVLEALYKHDCRNILVVKWIE